VPTPTSANVSTTAFRWAISPWGSSVSYNPYALAGYLTPFSGYVQMDLAYVLTRPKNPADPFYPELASSWTTGAHSITIHIRSDANWQDGKPVTSKDVWTSLMVSGGTLNQDWSAITSVSEPTSKTIVIDLKSWAVPANVLRGILQIPIVPASQFGPLLFKGMTADLLSYWKTYDPLHPTAASISAARNSAAGTALENFDTKLVKFAPKSLIGDGPYELTSVNTSEILLKKWSGWWDASKITAPWIEVEAMSNSTEFGALVGGRIDFENDTGYPDTQASTLDHSRYGHYVYVPAPVQQLGLIFNVRDYPFNMVQVRQALAYLINRKKVAIVEAGGKVLQHPPTRHPDGIAYYLGRDYLTSAQMDKLHAYRLNPSKAASLLRSVGFTERGGKWYTPKGQRFAVTVYAPSGYVGFDGDAVAVAGMLSASGIKSSADEVNAASYFTDQTDGQYPVSYGFADFGEINPLTYFDYTLVSLNYPVSYSGSGPCTNCHVAIGLGPQATVPGIGHVDIAAALNTEIETAPKSEWAKYVWDWARFVNEELPILPITNNSFGEAYADARYVDWPPLSQAWLWTSFGPQIVQFMQQGYLHLRSS
jgi:peptide/nickel transport system substrate-binding protein